MTTVNKRKSTTNDINPKIKKPSSLVVSSSREDYSSSNSSSGITIDESNNSHNQHNQQVINLELSIGLPANDNKTLVVDHAVSEDKSSKRQHREGVCLCCSLLGFQSDVVGGVGGGSNEACRCKGMMRNTCSLITSPPTPSSSSSDIHVFSFITPFNS